MFTIQDLNLICGVGWDRAWDDKISMRFHEQDEGFTEEVTVFCGPWQQKIALASPTHTAHLPVIMSFKLYDLRSLFHKLHDGYKNLTIVLPLEFTQYGFEVKNGPARGTRVMATKH